MYFQKTDEYSIFYMIEIKEYHFATIILILTGLVIQEPFGVTASILLTGTIDVVHEILKKDRTFIKWAVAVLFHRYHIYMILFYFRLVVI